MVASVLMGVLRALRLPQRPRQTGGSALRASSLFAPRFPRSLSLANSSVTDGSSYSDAPMNSSFRQTRAQDDSLQSTPPRIERVRPYLG